jgi:head-tail adaptor
MVAAVAIGCAAASAGDTPTAAYAAYRQAFDKATSLKDLLPHVKKESAAEVEQMSAERAEAGLRLVKRVRDVKDVQVTKETVTGETAVLELKAVRADGQPAKGTVSLAREKGAWKIDREDWPNGSASSGGPKGKSCAELLTDLNSSSMPDSQFAAGEIWQRDCPEVVPGLVAVLSHKEVWNRMWAAQALAMMGPRAKAAIPGMEAALKTETNGSIKEYLTKAIQKARG